MNIRLAVPLFLCTNDKHKCVTCLTNAKHYLIMQRQLSRYCMPGAGIRLRAIR